MSLKALHIYYSDKVEAKQFCKGIIVVWHGWIEYGTSTYGYVSMSFPPYLL